MCTNVHLYACRHVLMHIIHRDTCKEENQKEEDGVEEENKNKQRKKKTHLIWFKADLPDIWDIDLNWDPVRDEPSHEGLTDSYTECRQRWVCRPITGLSCTAQ